MVKTLEQVLARLPPAERREIEAEAAELIKREMTLRDMRKARDLTQQTMAKLLGVTQESISQLEQRSDALISTLSSYVKAMGGVLKLTAEFPGRPPVLITSFAMDEPASASRGGYKKVTYPKKGNKVAAKMMMAKGMAKAPPKGPIGKDKAASAAARRPRAPGAARG